MRRWRWMTAVVLVASACGGGDAGDDTTATGLSDPAAVLAEGTAAAEASPEAMIESGDALATLSLAPGSLPEGVALDDVRVEVMVTEDAVPGAPLMALRLLPDGLVLAEPARLTVALPEALDGGLMALHISGGSVEFLDGEIQQDDEGFSLRTTIGHFSHIHFYDGKTFFDTSVSANPDQVLVGETQRADVTITRKSGRQSLWLTFLDWDRGDDWYRLFTFSPSERIEHSAHLGGRIIVLDLARCEQLLATREHFAAASDQELVFGDRPDSNRLRIVERDDGEVGSDEFNAVRGSDFEKQR